MNIQEVANSYADGKANEAITKAIAQAYIDGFNDGYKSGKENAQIECNDTEFVDLGLPSGTLWASDYVRDENGKICYFTYEEALKYRIPTQEQYDELTTICLRKIFRDKSNHYCGAKILGPNGNTFTFTISGKIEFDSLSSADIVYFWLLDSNSDNNKLSACITYNEILKAQMFCGFKLPVRLVR